MSLVSLVYSLLRADRLRRALSSPLGQRARKEDPSHDCCSTRLARCRARRPQVDLQKFADLTLEQALAAVAPSDAPRPRPKGTKGLSRKGQTPVRKGGTKKRSRKVRAVPRRAAIG